MSAAELFHETLLTLMEREGLTSADLARQLPEVERQTVQKWVKGSKKKGHAGHQVSVPDGIRMAWLMRRFGLTPDAIVGAPEPLPMGPAASLAALQEQVRVLQAQVAALAGEVPTTSGPVPPSTDAAVAAMGAIADADQQTGHATKGQRKRKDA